MDSVEHTSVFSWERYFPEEVREIARTVEKGVELAAEAPGITDNYHGVVRVTVEATGKFVQPYESLVSVSELPRLPYGELYAVVLHQASGETRRLEGNFFLLSDKTSTLALRSLAWKFEGVWARAADHVVRKVSRERIPLTIGCRTAEDIVKAIQQLVADDKAAQILQLKPMALALSQSAAEKFGDEFRGVVTQKRLVPQSEYEHIVLSVRCSNNTVFKVGTVSTQKLERSRQLPPIRRTWEEIMDKFSALIKEYDPATPEVQRDLAV